MTFSSADNICKHFDILTAFLKEFFESVNFENKSADDNTSMKNYPFKELNNIYKLLLVEL